VGDPPRSGAYKNGNEESTSHYVITLSIPSHGRVNGTVTFIGANGSATNELTFTGTTRFGTASVTTSTGHTLSMAYSDEGFDFGLGCDGVFHFAESHADCMFAFDHN
jgi:hypothetical protein